MKCYDSEYPWCVDAKYTRHPTYRFKNRDDARSFAFALGWQYWDHGGDCVFDPGKATFTPVEIGGVS